MLRSSLTFPVRYDQPLSSEALRRAENVHSQADSHHSEPSDEGCRALEVLRTNPLEGIKPPKDIRKEPDVLTKEQVLRLLEVVRDDRFECIYVLCALLGLRIGETLALRWNDVDLDRGTLQVRRTLWHGKTSQRESPLSNTPTPLWEKLTPRPISTVTAP